MTPKTRPSTHAHYAAASTAVAIVCAACSASPQDPDPIRSEIIDESLHAITLDLVGFDDDRLTTIDAAGKTHTEPKQGTLAILNATPRGSYNWTIPDDQALAGGTPVVIELTDGQRFIGSVGPWDSASVGSAGAIPPDSIGILASGHQIKSLPFERIGRVIFNPWVRNAARPGDWQAGIEDSLILVNGDTLRGFLVSVDESVVFDPGTGDREFSIGRVAEIRLGNEPQAHQGPRLWMRTGEIINADSAHNLPESEIPEIAFVQAESIIAVWLDDRAPIPLADLELVALEPGKARRWAREPDRGSAWASPLGIASVAIDGPVRTAWSLPPQAASFSAAAHLGGDLDNPARTPGPWADAVLTISIESNGSTQALATIQLSTQQPDADIAVALPGVGNAGRRLIIELGEGRFGPIQDRLLLRRPFLLGL